MDEPNYVVSDEYREENIEREVITITHSNKHDRTITFHVDPDVDIVLHGDGRVSYSKPPDEAAAAFWKAVEMFAKNNGIRFYYV